MKLTLANTLKPLLLASLMACSYTAMAQDPPAAGPGKHRMEKMDPAKMQAMQAKHQAAMKEKLKITADQEGAWSAFTAAMNNHPNWEKNRADRHAEMSKLTTPERLEKRKVMRAEHNAQMEKREEAVKNLYAVLTPEQKKIFDAQHPPGGRHEKHMKGGK